MGGAERMMVHTANELSRHVNVSFITLTGNGVLEGELNRNISLVSLDRKKSLHAFFPLCDHLRNVKPDVLISTQIHINLIAMLVKLFCRTSTKIILREATTPGSQFRTFRDNRSRLVKYAVRWPYPKADAIVAICEAVRMNLLQHRFARPEQISVIYNPVVNETLLTGQKETVSHRFFGMGVPVFISVGRLAAAKNFSLLLEAFAKVVKVRDARLLIIGSGPEHEALLAKSRTLKVEDKVDFTGQIINPFPFLAGSDVYVLSSFFEGLPNALIEAMACGIQLVSVDCPGGSREVLENGSLGQLVSMNDSQALAEAMLNALKNPVDRNKLISGADRFTTQKTSEAYLRLIKDLTHAG
jgi:glycosyltransferase involved in cell wall biosynthesis